MQDSYLAPVHTSKPLTVFYDGECPLCRREIGFYRRQNGAAMLDWIDVANSGTPMVAPGLPACSALARFHVMDSQGRLFSGGAAFVQLWMKLPALRWLGRIFHNAPMTWVLERGYDFSLRIRPGLQRIFRR